MTTLTIPTSELRASAVCSDYLGDGDIAARLRAHADLAADASAEHTHGRLDRFQAVFAAAVPFNEIDPVVEKLGGRVAELVRSGSRHELAGDLAAAVTAYRSVDSLIGDAEEEGIDVRTIWEKYGPHDDYYLDYRTTLPVNTDAIDVIHELVEFASAKFVSLRGLLHP